MTDLEHVIFRARLGALEEAALHLEGVAGTKPCDCIEQYENGSYGVSCECQNTSDTCMAAEWCCAMNQAQNIRDLINRK